MTSMNISLPQELKEYIEQQTKIGYSTPSEYVRELIRGDQGTACEGAARPVSFRRVSTPASRCQPRQPSGTELKRDAMAKLRKKHQEMNQTVPFSRVPAWISWSSSCTWQTRPLRDSGRAVLYCRGSHMRPTGQDNLSRERGTIPA
jgi:Arc/MetJ-type ribon-helix-helix transcriptional regulator